MSTPAPETPPQDLLECSRQLGERLRERGWTCATAESITGGYIGHLLTAISGSSDYFLGGILAYGNEAKTKILNVRQETLERVGAVSPECAREMATGARSLFGASIGIASTGIAGPGGATARKPLGLVYLAVAWPGGVEVREIRLQGDRLENIQASASTALQLAREIFRDD
jgi:PncC family amidohydrolase